MYYNMTIHNLDNIRWFGESMDFLGFQVLDQYKERKEHFGSLEISLKAMKTACDLLFLFNPYDHLPDYSRVWEKSDLQAIGVPDEPMYPRPRKSIDEILVKR